MHVVFASDLETLGGAGIGAARLANGLAALGHKVTWLFNNPNRAPFGEEVSWSSQYVGPGRPLAVGLNGAKRFVPELSRAAGERVSSLALQRALKGLPIDVLHVHAIHNCYWTHDTFRCLSPELPVTWTFHDNWSFSGESYLFRDLDGREVRMKPDGQDPAASIARKQRYFRSRKRLALVGNSHFTSNAAQGALGLPVHTIPYGLPLDKFAPVRKLVAREALGLPGDAFIVGFIADNRGEPVKGFEVLRRALGKVSGVEAIAIGEGATGDLAIGSVHCRVFSRVSDPRLLALFYSAANVFVVPSLAEALGMVGMESIACGTPVIGSNVGGIPDVVEDGRTGWLFPPRDSETLARLISELAAAPQRALSLAEECRAFALRRWALLDRAREHVALYEGLLRGGEPRSAA